MADPYQSPIGERAAESRTGSSLVYYGWVIVGCAALAMAATLPGRTHGLGLITKPLLNDFPALSEQSFAHINLAATLIGALFCLPCGWLLDRFGTRTVLLSVMAALGIVVLWLSQVKEVATLIVAITLTRGIGQSMLSVVSITMVGKWFQRNLSAAMGVYSFLMTILMAASFGVVGERVQSIGWRAAWWELGLGIVVITPLMGILAKSMPRDRREFENARHPAISGATLGQALRTPCFWMFAGSISFFGLVSSGVSLFQQLILEERGFDHALFMTVVVIGLLAGMVSNLAVGGLARVVPLQTLLAIGLLLLGASLAVLPMIKTAAQAYAYAVAYGVAGGFITVLFFAIWGYAFGDKHLGRIQSAAQMLTVFASAVGPEFIAGSRTSSNSSAPILYAFAIVAVALGILAYFTPTPSARDGAWDNA